MYVCMYVYMYLYIDAYMYTYIYIYTHTCIHVCIYACICFYMHVCGYVWVAWQWLTGGTPACFPLGPGGGCTGGWVGDGKCDTIEGINSCTNDIL